MHGMDPCELPKIIYGTAWKKEATTSLVQCAVRAGFRAIDTANQPKHYREALVGAALEQLAGEGISRESLFLQSKFTFAGAHDANIPYDPEADYATQVRSSFAGTLRNLRTTYLDSYLLHGPIGRTGLQAADWQVWRALEELCREGQVRRIGVANISMEQLAALDAEAKVRPSFVQNRCYARFGWDQEVREYCEENGISYQGFALLKVNEYVVSSPQVRALAEKFQVAPEQVILRFAQQISVLPLTGTTSERHMTQDLAIANFQLCWDDLSLIAGLPTD